jgi:hypothetical protein
MGATNILNAIILDCGGSPGDYPRGYQLFLSKDGTNWGVPAATGSGAIVTSIAFPAEAARYFRVTQTGSAPANWWSIAELSAYGSFGLASAPPVTLSAALSSNNTLALTWTTNVAVTLFYTTNLTPPATWTQVTNPPAIVNGQWTVTLSIGPNPAAFYRLQY